MLTLSHFGLLRLSTPLVADIPLHLLTNEVSDGTPVQEQAITLLFDA